MPDDLASRIFTGGQAGRLQSTGGTSLVAGIQGDSGVDGIQRVYLDPGLKSYVEFQGDLAATNQELSTGIFDCTGWWLPQNQELTWWFPVPTTASNISAPKLARASGAAFRAAAARGASNVPGTARIDPFTVGGAIWGGLEALGWADDVEDAVGGVIDDIGGFLGGLF